MPQEEKGENTNATQNEPEEEKPESESESESDSESDSESESESETESDSSDTEPEKDKTKQETTTPYYTRPGEYLDIPEDDNSPEANIERFRRALTSRRYLRAEKQEEKSIVHHEDLYDFPRDKENWREEDLRELWADAPLAATKPGWDPVWADEEDWQVVEDEVLDGKDPTIAPFYLPYRKHYPAIPDNHYDISNPKSVIEELDRIEEFLRWVSYIFQDGSSYEGTVWDDLAHGKGVYVAEQGLVRYEGEWLQNNMEGHGVVEVDIPDIEPIPGSKLEAQMRAEGKIIKRDFMTPEDREWLEMDIEDSVRLTNGNYEIPWYENDEWIRQYGQKPEKGRYRYAGEWKHSRMHGCGVYDVNERTIYGRFYFGELVEDPDGLCDNRTCALHSGIAEVAAAKARMFINKPDGMVREERGPYGDPQHPYFYEEEDVWQAPGFINQFYEVPDYWKTYVHEVDEEREMWVDSFYKAPLRLPMPAELEHWWERERPDEFIILNKEPEPDPNDPSKLIYTEDPVILHTPTGRIINYIDDEEHGIRMFWQPEWKEGEEIDPSKVEFLPLGFDEFYGREEVVPKESFITRLASKINNACTPWLDKLEVWTEEQRKASNIRLEILEQERQLEEAELTLEELLEDMEEYLKIEEEAAKGGDINLQDADATIEQEEKVSLPEEVKEDEDGDGDGDDDGEDGDEVEGEDLAPSSFGSVLDTGSTKDKNNGPGKSPFSTLSIASSGLLSTVPLLLERSFSLWKKERCPPKAQIPSSSISGGNINCPESLTFHQSFPENMILKMKNQSNRKFRAKQLRKSTAAPKIHTSSCPSTRTKENHKAHSFSTIHWLHTPPETNLDIILSLNIPVQCLD